MHRIESEFPDKSRVWQGAVLGSIAHAVAVSRYPSISNEQSWDGRNYSVQDSAGSRGTIAFSDERLVAVFFLDRSERNPFRSTVAYDLASYFEGMPKVLRPLAFDEALQYVLQELRGSTCPVITSAFWGDENTSAVSAAESWGDVFKHGAVLIKNQLLGPQESLAAWQAEYGLAPVEVAMIGKLFEQKMANPLERIVLDGTFRNMLEENANGSEGVEASREAFSEIGIVMA